MDRNNAIRAAKLGYILISGILCLLGMVLIVIPDLSLILLCRVGGVLMILFGLVKLLGYCSKDLYRLAFQYDLAFGILLIALGVTMCLRTIPMISIVCTMLGFYVLADALLKVQISLDARVFGLRKWWLILAAAIGTGMAGFLLIFRPSESAGVIMGLLGISLLTEGILNLVTILTAVKVMRRPLPEDRDGDYVEIP